jgi:SAM-dependent methyltransferase
MLRRLLQRFNLLPTPLLDTHAGMARARAILEANRLGFFHALAESPRGMTAAEVAERTQVSPDGAAILLTALRVIGYVSQRGDRYTNNPVVTRWIVDPDRGLTNYLRLQCQVWSRLELLGDTIRRGRPDHDVLQDLAGKESTAQRDYTMAMHDLAAHLVPRFAQKATLPAGAKRLLDIGGAHGNFSRALARKYPGLKATVFDLPGPIATARELLAAENALDSVELRAGDALTEPLGTDWDGVLMASVVHAFDPKQNQKLFARIHEALTPNGVFLAFDQFLGRGGWRDTVPGLMSLNLFTVGGRCYHLDDLQAMLRQAGFRRFAIKPVCGSILVEAWKK